jgi:membrane-associated phospholipid phosphatase
MSAVAETPSIPALWREAAPRTWDSAIPWWVKALIVVAAAVLCMLFVDQRVAVWAYEHRQWIPDLMRPRGQGDPGYGDLGRELMYMEQMGQFSSTVMAICAVALIDKAGRRRALAVAIACILTVLLTHFLKDMFGRSRPFTARFSRDGHWEWGGPAKGFSGGSAWGSFPSAHTTSAFALASGLAWFYPRGRILFMYLATFTATLRVLHYAHYVSDVVAGMGIGVFVARITLHYSLAGWWIRLSPKWAQRWWMKNYSTP